jgi:ammonium transporter, Amt family
VKLILLVGPVRASARDEGLGLDVTQHGEEAYSRGEGAILVLSEAGTTRGLPVGSPVVLEGEASTT